MSQPTAGPRRPSAQQLPPQVVQILAPSLQVGLSAGAAGLFVGAVSGIVRGAAPVLFSLVTGAQWFALGGSYYATRAYTTTFWGGEDKISRSDKVKASALAGASAGLVGGLIRGPRNILPAIAVFSVFGATGQAVLNAMPAPDPKAKKTDWLASKWSPVKQLSDEEYARFIDDKILKLEVEVSMIDDKIAVLNAAKEQKSTKSTGSTGGNQETQL